MQRGEHELKHGILGLGDAFAQSFALLSLALGSSLATSLVARRDSVDGDRLGHRAHARDRARADRLGRPVRARG